ncbi:MAG TPA: 50S ribosomal protein L35 [candidate division Zixibacteria bacterium]|jgi:large subunit ribosomal protein L35
MPKMKTRRAAAKRFRRLKSGLIKRSKAYRGHLSKSKSTKRQRQLRQSTYISDGDLRRVNKMLGHG